MTGGPLLLIHVEPRVWTRGLLKRFLAREEFSALESISFLRISLTGSHCSDQSHAGISVPG